MVKADDGPQKEKNHPQEGLCVPQIVQPLTVYGDGAQTRSFCFVSDLIDGLQRLMRVEELYQPVNLGNPEEFTILELAEEILALSGSGSGVEFRPRPQDDPVRRRPDISRARELLDWEPRVSLRQGLQRTIDYFDNLLREPARSPIAT